jgi:hypothetical protein
MALNSEAKLKAKFGFTEEPSMQLEVFLLLFFSCIEFATGIKCFRRWYCRRRSYMCTNPAPVIMANWLMNQCVFDVKASF